MAKIKIHTDKHINTHLLSKEVGHPLAVNHEEGWIDCPGVDTEEELAAFLSNHENDPIKFWPDWKQHIYSELQAGKRPDLAPYVLELLERERRAMENR